MLMRMQKGSREGEMQQVLSEGEKGEIMPIELSMGIHANVPFDEYLSINAVSNSYLGRLSECPAKARLPREDTPSLMLGRAVHKLVLEGEEKFAEEFAVAPENDYRGIKIDRRTKAGKDAWAEFEAEKQGRNILKKEDADNALAIADAVYSHPWAKKLLAENVTEQTIIWSDKDTGLLCKGRPDAIPAKDKCALVDLKTTRDASLEAFTRAVIQYGYHRQAAFYIDGYGSAAEVYVDMFIFIAVEPLPPHRTEVYVLDDEFIGAGREAYKQILRREVECRQTGVYPHYTQDGITEIFKPGWLI